MRGWLLALGLLACAPTTWAGDVAASAPTSLAVTIYRAPDREGGSIDLGNLAGFALVTETRTIHLPAGESRLRFEGVVDGIDPASAIVAGLPDGVIEKNQDAALLSPSALLKAAVGSEVNLVRTNRKTGKSTVTPARIRSASDQGVVFETAEGVEALQCSGASETFTFRRLPAGLNSTPTLSVLTRSSREVTATVTLTYLTTGFDWAADYVATLHPDGGTLDLGAWVTLANGNGVGLPNADARIVAGKVNREEEDQQDQSDTNESSTVVATCWPQGTTSVAPPSPALLAPAAPLMVPAPPPPMMTRVEEMVVTARKVAPPERLGDLKLYRIPGETTVASRQSKQVRLLDQANVPFERLATADLPADGDDDGFHPATTMLRTINDAAHHLGMPLPSGAVSVFTPAGDRNLLIGSAKLRDTALKETIELRLGEAPDVQVRQTQMERDALPPTLLRISRGFTLAIHNSSEIESVEVSNARDTPTPFELRLRPDEDEHVTAADRPMTLKDGRPLFHFTLPPHGKVTVHYTVKEDQ